MERDMPAMEIASGILTQGGRRTEGGRVSARIRALGEFRERVHTLSLGQLLRSLIPRRYDVFLFQGTRESLASTPAPVTPLSVTIERYGPGGRTGRPEIDAFLVGTREVYVAKVDGVIAHRCALSFSFAKRAERFGFPPGPFVIEGLTFPPYRAKGLQSVMRRYLVEEALRRGWKCLYSEVEPENAASMKGNARGGLRTVGRLQAVKFAGMSLRRRVAPTA
jgi:hypothetical protein